MAFSPVPLVSKSSFRSPSLPNDVSLKLYSLLTNSQPDFSEVLELLRRADIEEGEVTEKGGSLARGRCPLCTMTLPCRHFASKKEARESMYRGISETPQPATVHAPSEPLDQSLGEFRPPLAVTSRKFRVRYRSSQDVSFSLSAHMRSSSLKDPKKTEFRRSKLIEKLDNYRKERCRREIEKIEEYRKREEAAQQEAAARELRRVQRDKKLKAALEQHHSELAKTLHTKQEALLEQLREQKAQERRRLRYIRKQVMNRQKEKLEVYKRKKQIIDGIQRDQVEELGMCYTEEEIVAKVREDV